jgi:chromosome partitioning protein
MALTISVAALKGGVGKSTLSINLATYLHSCHHRVLLVDGDSQGTCRGWSEIAASAERDVPPVVSMGAEMRRNLARVADGFGAVVVDTPPRLGAEQRAAMLVSDLVLIPVTPGPADVWALQETLALLDEARALRPEIKAAIVLNRVSARTSLAAVTREAIEQSGVPLLHPAIGNRVAFAEAIASGQGVTTYAAESPAAAEIATLAGEAMRMVEA